jgi:hypothetical protein
MGDAPHTVTTSPTERPPGCPFDPPPQLLEARRQSPISAYEFRGGKPGRLVTGYDLVRQILVEVPPAPPR